MTAQVRSPVVGTPTEINNKKGEFRLQYSTVRTTSKTTVQYELQLNQNSQVKKLLETRL